MSRKGVVKLQEFVAHLGNVHCGHIGRKSGQVLVTGGEDKRVSVWTIGKPNAIMSLTGHSSPVHSVMFDMNEEHVFAGSEGGSIRLWNLGEQKVVRTFSGAHRSSVTCMDMHPYCDLFCSGSLDTNVRLWDTRKKQPLLTLKGHSGRVNCVCFSPDGRWISSGSDDGYLKLWDLTAGKLLMDLKARPVTRGGGSGSGGGISAVGSGSSVVSGSCGATSSAVMKQGAAARPYGAITSIDFHPNEFFLAAGGSDRSLAVWDLETFHQVSNTDSADTQPIEKVRFRADGHSLLSVSSESVRSWKWSSGTEMALQSVVDAPWNAVADVHVNHEFGQMVSVSTYQSFVSIWIMNVGRMSEYSKLGAPSTAGSSAGSAISVPSRPAPRVATAPHPEGPSSRRAVPTAPPKETGWEREKDETFVTHNVSKVKVADDRPPPRPKSPKIDIVVSRKVLAAHPETGEQRAIRVAGVSGGVGDGDRPSASSGLDDPFRPRCLLHQDGDRDASSASSLSSSRVHSHHGHSHSHHAPVVDEKRRGEEMGSDRGKLSDSFSLVFSDIGATHDVVQSVMASRIMHVRAMRLLWERGEIDQMAEMLRQVHDPVVPINLFSSICRSSSFSLDQANRIFPVMKSVIPTIQNDYHMQQIQKTILHIIELFRDAIRDTVVRGPGSLPGVDLSREDRMKRARLALNHLLDLRMHVSSRMKSKGMDASSSSSSRRVSSTTPGTSPSFAKCEWDAHTQQTHADLLQALDQLQS
jgi:katanin p80 WD40 repeat-containing subunit B1